MPIIVIPQTYFCGQKMIRPVDFPIGAGEIRVYLKGGSYLVNKLT